MGSSRFRPGVCSHREKIMPAYVIARVDITEREQYQHYMKAFPAVIISVRRKSHCPV